MKYFIDFEFLEGDVPYQIKGFNIPRWLIKPNNTIQPISVGICSSDGREYYAISKDFNLKEAWNRYDLVKYAFKDCGMTPLYKKVYWIRENVLKPIFIELRAKEVEEYNIAERRNVILDFPTYSFCFKEFKRLIKKYGKTNKQIAKEIIEFCKPIEGNPLMWNKKGYEVVNIGKENSYVEPTFGVDYIGSRTAPEFYGYYSDYDWVVFCWLFGKMIDLPKGFPMYCIDLKQSLDQLIIDELPSLRDKNGNIPPFEEGLRLMKSHRNYPIQSDEHHSLKDAEWIHKLYNFLNSDIYGRN